MNIKSLLLFAGGLVIGGAAGILGTKKYFQDKYQKQYEKDHNDLEAYYKHVDEYSRQEHDQHEEEDNEVNPEESDTKPGGRMSQEERAAVKEKLKKNWKGTTNYANMYREKHADEEEDLAEKEYPTEEDDEEDINPEDEDHFNEHQKNRNKSPKIISAEAYSNLPAYVDQEVLYYYSIDSILCDENEEPVEEPGRLVGDALDKYGFADNEERLIFVMNYALDTCYEIQKVDAAWSDSH